MSMTIYKGMKQKERRVPVAHSPWKGSTQRALVVHQKGEELTITRIVDLAVPSDIRSKDTSHAFINLRKFIFFHTNSELNFTGMLTSELVAELQQKTQSTGLWDKSLTQAGDTCCCKDFGLNVVRTLNFRVANIQHN